MVWNLRQELTGGLTETLVAHAHLGEQARKQAPCPRCQGLLRARSVVSRTGETMVGPVQLERPYFYCRGCRCGAYPCDEALGLLPGCTQLDGQQAAAKVVPEMPYDEAQTLFGDLTGVGMGSERMPTLSHQVAEGLPVLDVAPSRHESARRMALVAQGRFRRPVLVVGIAGAYVPTRPESARGRRPGQARQRARRAQWKGQGRDAQGFRLYLMDGDRIVHLVSWHQRQNEADLGEALKHVQDAGLIPEDQVRLWVGCDGASWIWQHGASWFPDARQGLDYYHGAAYLHGVAKAPYGSSLQGLEWVEATMPRLYRGKGASVLGGLRRMQPASDEAAKAIAHCGDYLDAHRGRTA